MRIKPFRLVFGSITDSDNQGKVTGGNIVDRDNQAIFSLIMTDNHEGRHFSPNISNSADDSPDQTVDRMKSNIFFEVPTRLHPYFLVLTDRAVCLLAKSAEVSSSTYSAEVSSSTVFPSFDSKFFLS
jgi:hypothetical protein